MHTRILITFTIINKFSIKFYVAIAAILILGLLLVFLSINEVNGIKLPFWNLGSALGLGFIMIGLVRVRDFRRRRSFSLVNNSNSIITINEEEILYSRADVQVTYKWNYFKLYQVTSQFILLIRDSTLIQIFIVGRDETNKEQFEFIESQFCHNQNPENDKTFCQLSHYKSEAFSPCFCHLGPIIGLLAKSLQKPSPHLIQGGFRGSKGSSPGPFGC
jgi:hypothetical protein